MSAMNKDGLIVIGGAGGFIGGSLAKYFLDNGFARIRAIDKNANGNMKSEIANVTFTPLSLNITNS